MKTNAIRIMLDYLYEIAEKQGIDLLTVPGYCFICRVIQAYNQDNEINLYEKRACRDDLEALCFALGVNYKWLVHKALADIGFYDEK